VPPSSGDLNTYLITRCFAEHRVCSSNITPLCQKRPALLAQNYSHYVEIYFSSFETIAWQGLQESDAFLANFILEQRVFEVEILAENLKRKVLSIMR